MNDDGTSSDRLITGGAVALPTAYSPGAGVQRGGTTTVFVCISCGPNLTEAGAAPTADGTEKPGASLVAALRARLAPDAGLIIEPVECLAVCKRACTVALKADGKWTYIVGDLDPARHVDEILAAATAYDRSDNGIVAWRERPQTFRKGVIARVPPIGFVQPMAAPTKVLPT
jgi:predicted metal-binding protein